MKTVDTTTTLTNAGLEQIEEHKSWQSEEHEDLYTETIQLLESITFDKYLETLGEVISEKEKKTYHFDHENLEKLDPIRKHIFSNAASKMSLLEALRMDLPENGLTDEEIDTYFGRDRTSDAHRWVDL